MLKFVTIVLVAFSMFGCASKGSVTALEDRVTALEEADKVTVKQLDVLTSDNAALQSNVAEINAKLDRGFRKGN